MKIQELLAIQPIYLVDSSYTLVNIAPTFDFATIFVHTAVIGK